MALANLRHDETVYGVTAAEPFAAGTTAGKDAGSDAPGANALRLNDSARRHRLIPAPPDAAHRFSRLAGPVLLAAAYVGLTTLLF